MLLELLFPTLLLGLAHCQEPPPPVELPVLGLGAAIEGRLDADAPPVSTPALDKGFVNAPTVGVSFRVRVPATGIYHVDLRAYAFDSYLVLRGPDGALLAEEDDGLLGKQARLVTELQAGVDYQVTACALHGARGPCLAGRVSPRPAEPRNRPPSPVRYPGPTSTYCAMLFELLFPSLIHLAAPQEPPARPALEVGAPREAVIADADPPISTPTLDANYIQAPTVGKTFRLRVAEPGTYRVDLHSFAFDAYLVLRDSDGALIGEDDDGLLGTHARLVAELDAGVEYHLSACALHGGRGRFRLDVIEGRPVDLSRSEREAAFEE
ncbi:MAG TPA: hypothetical protein VGC54_12630, partial [Planctomycetota bacterium]